MWKLPVRVVVLCALAARLAPANDGAPDQIHLAWTADTATTMTVVWRTLDKGVPSTVEYRRKGDSKWLRATGALRPSGTTGKLHEVQIRNLKPATRYEYRVAGPGNTWSPAHSFATAHTGNAPFEVIYVADTGMDGRADGLSTGTREVVEEVAKYDPLLILWGGDAAYYNTDKRYGSLDNTIDAWFNMVMPFAVKAPMMPTYGNHEIYLKEGYLFWADRNPTPEGHDNRRFYSFDVGDVHFTSILAAESEVGGLAYSALKWIDEDLEKARKSGKKWIIPYMHVAPFSDGSNHPSNLDLRAQLGPIFEKHKIRVVLTCHDQSYERTYPVRGVPDKIEITNGSKDCYGANDGTVYLKVGPGGKQSNINGRFANFKTNPPPAHTAFRDNTAHHFARLFFDKEDLRVEILGILRGKPTVLQDKFRYTLGSCSAGTSN